MTRMHLFSLAMLGSALAACGSNDTSNDVPFPPGGDAGTDSTVDAPPDVADDRIIGPDAGPDATPEAAPDVVVDTGPDVQLDVATDVQADVQVDGPGPDTGNPWPTCDAQPSGVPALTLSEIWSTNPTDPTEVWVSGLYVTAISYGKCSAGSACQVFLQDALTYPSFAAGAHHGMKLFVSSNTAQHFETLAVGDRVDVLAHAWRYDVNPSQNELLLQVNNSLRGCAKKIGEGTPAPIEGVQLTDLTVDAYENTHGPVLVKVDGVSGKPGVPSETFALWKTGGPFVEAGIDSVVSASPYFLTGGSFSGLPTNATTTVSFSSITGVFGLFVPSGDGGGAKYLMLYPRTMADMPKL